MRVEVLDKLPARDASVRIEVDKSPAAKTRTPGPHSTVGVTDQGIRVDVLDRPGLYGDFAILRIQPSGQPIRLFLQGPSPNVASMSVRTVATLGPAAPWKRAHTLREEFQDGDAIENVDYVANLGEDDALAKIQREFTDELITFRVRVESG